MNNQSQPSFTQHPSADPTEGTGISTLGDVPQCEAHSKRKAPLCVSCSKVLTVTDYLFARQPIRSGLGTVWAQCVARIFG
jgi:hypothetical protein